MSISNRDRRKLMGKKKKDAEEKPQISEEPKEEPSKSAESKKRTAVVQEATVGLREYASTNAGPDILLMAGFVGEERAAGRLRDTAANYQKRFEQFKVRPVK
jgi:hypothetical protein